MVHLKYSLQRKKNYLQQQNQNSTHPDPLHYKSRYVIFQVYILSTQSLLSYS